MEMAVVNPHGSSGGYHDRVAAHYCKDCKGGKN